MSEEKGKDNNNSGLGIGFLEAMFAIVAGVLITLSPLIILLLLAG